MVLSFGGHSPAHAILPSFLYTLNPFSPETERDTRFSIGRKRLFWGSCPEEVSKLDVFIIAAGMCIRHNVREILLALYWSHRDAVHYTHVYIYIPNNIVSVVPDHSQKSRPSITGSPPRKCRGFPCTVRIL